jgi:hypothetical protein
MAWNPAIPATNADLLSAPVRDNFGALDTALMAALATLGNGSVLTKAAGPVLAGIPAVATGAVLASAGVTTAPTWSASPALTDLTLSGGAIGTSGVGVLALGPATAPTTSPVDTVQLYTADMSAEAGSRALILRDERGNLTEIGSIGAPVLRVTQKVGTVETRLSTGSTTASIGTISNHQMAMLQNGVARITLGTDTSIHLLLPGLGDRFISYGGIDSGGSGYRMLVVTN